MPLHIQHCSKIPNYSHVLIKKLLTFNSKLVLLFAHNMYITTTLMVSSYQQ